MEVYFQLINDADSLKEACEGFESERFLGFDTETTEIEPFNGILRLVQLSNGKNTIVIDLKPFAEKGNIKKMPELETLRQLLAAKTSVKIAHNAKFDAKWIAHHLGVELGAVFDTFLASQIIAAGSHDRRHSLAEVSRFFIGTELDKSEQASDWRSDELSQSQIEYAAKDAAVMIPLREKLERKLKADGLYEVAKLEFDCVTPIAVMELNGFFLDEKCWKMHFEAIKARQEKATLELQEMLSVGVAQGSLFGAAKINLNSQTQVANALKNLGIPVSETTQGWRLQPLANKYPVVNKLLEYRSLAKSLTSFGDNILEFIHHKTGKIHANFRQIGAPSGRFSCSKPNLQQIPHDKAYRRCFRAGERQKLIVADYSQIELRILAEFSGDENFIEAFRAGEDFHSSSAAQLFGITPEEVTSEQRSFAKRLNFGVVYGIGSRRFAMMTGISQMEAENIMRSYFSTYRGLDSWLRTAAERAVRDRRTRTLSGRTVKFRFDEGDRHDKQKVASIRRYGKNIPIQGTSADILKRALRLLHDAFRCSSAKLVNIVHDEIIVEVDEKEANEAARKLEDSMIQAAREYVSKVPVKINIEIADKWMK